MASHFQKLLPLNGWWPHLNDCRANKWLTFSCLFLSVDFIFWKENWSTFRFQKWQICVPPTCTCIKCMLMISSCKFLQLGGLTLLAMGIWVSVDGSSFLHLLEPFSSQGMQFVNVGFFCIAIGAVLVLLGLLGSCGAHKESKCLLLTVSEFNLPPLAFMWCHSCHLIGCTKVTSNMSNLIEEALPCGSVSSMCSHNSSQKKVILTVILHKLKCNFILVLKLSLFLYRCHLKICIMKWDQHPENWLFPTHYFWLPRVRSIGSQMIRLGTCSRSYKGMLQCHSCLHYLNTVHPSNSCLNKKNKGQSSEACHFLASCSLSFKTNEHSSRRRDPRLHDTRQRWSYSFCPEWLLESTQTQSSIQLL